MEISDPSEAEQLISWEAYKKFLAETEKKEG